MNTFGVEPFSSLGDIRFYDRNLNLLCVLPRYISVDWQIKHRAWGTVEIHLPKNADTIRLLTEHKRLFLMQGEMQAVVTGYRIEKDCAIFGRTCDWLLSKFTVISYEANVTGAYEIACDMVRKTLPGVEMMMEGEEADVAEHTEFIVEKAMDLYAALLLCFPSENTGIWFGFDVEEKRFIFRVYRGTERKDTIFSEEMKTLHDASYTDNILNHAEGGVYYQKITHCGKWNPKENIPKLSTIARHFGTCYTVTEDADSTVLGLSVKKGDVILCKSADGTFCITDSTDPFPVDIPPENKDIFSWHVLLSSDNRIEAEQELKRKKEQTVSSGKLRTLMQEPKFYPGDTVSVEFSAEEFVHAEQRRISGVHFWKNEQGSGCIPETVSMEPTEETDSAE